MYMGDGVIVETIPDSLGDPGRGCNAVPPPAAIWTALTMRGRSSLPAAEPAGLTATPQKSEPSNGPGHWAGGQQTAT